MDWNSGKEKDQEIAKLTKISGFFKKQLHVRDSSETQYRPNI